MALIEIERPVYVKIGRRKWHRMKSVHITHETYVTKILGPHCRVNGHRRTLELIGNFRPWRGGEVVIGVRCNGVEQTFYTTSCNKFGRIGPLGGRSWMWQKFDHVS